jgi:hypothetical protein
MMRSSRGGRSSRTQSAVRVSSAHASSVGDPERYLVGLLPSKGELAVAIVVPSDSLGVANEVGICAVNLATGKVRRSSIRCKAD